MYVCHSVSCCLAYPVQTLQKEAGELLHTFMDSTNIPHVYNIIMISSVQVAEPLHLYAVLDPNAPEASDSDATPGCYEAVPFSNTPSTQPSDGHYSHTEHHLPSDHQSMGVVSSPLHLYSHIQKTSKDEVSQPACPPVYSVVAKKGVKPPMCTESGETARPTSSNTDEQCNNKTEPDLTVDFDDPIYSVAH